jgi:TMEM175 potassium channel family protein
VATNADRSPERLVFFSDAVVAIALTLLILPLVDAVQEASAEHAHSFDLISTNQWKIFSFLLSFVVIARMWRSHHRLFEQLKAVNRALVTVNFGWLLTIVVLPFPTEMVGKFDQDRLTVALYVGTMLAADIFLLTMVSIARATPEITKNGTTALDRQRLMATITTGLLAVALALVALVPSVGYSAFLLLFLIRPISWLWRRRSTDAA